MLKRRYGLSFVLLFSGALAMSSACSDEDPAPSGDGGMCMGNKAYLAACGGDDECSSCTCKSFGHSRVCSKACTGDADCPAPSGGCTQGFCRP
jgi:hypothetical protein